MCGPTSSSSSSRPLAATTRLVIYCAAAVAVLLQAMMATAQPAAGQETVDSQVPGSSFGKTPPPQLHRVPIPEDPCLDLQHCIASFGGCCQEHHEEFPDRKHPKGLPGVTSLQHLKLRKEICSKAKALILKQRGVRPEQLTGREL